MLLLGFSSGLPILLIFSTLSVWLFKAGIDRSTITLFSWVGFTYAFKYLWSPIVDNFKIPFFDKGATRDWSKSLDGELKLKIENSFKEEMLDLGYL